MKRLVAFAAACALTLCVVVTGCSGKSIQNGSAAAEDVEESKSGLPEKDAIKIDDIDWSVDDGIDDGSRRVMFTFTNNSDYPIASLKLESTIREDASSEEIQAAYDYIIEQGSTKDDVRSSTFTCESTYVVEPGDTSNPDACGFRGYYVVDLKQYELTEPDLLTIQYLYGDDLYTEYFDFKSESYSMDSEVIDTKQWSDSDLAALLPQPEKLLVTDTMDIPSQFSFDTVSTTQDEFNAYVEECKEKGFTANPVATEDTYYADSEDGLYHLDLIRMSNGDLSAYLNVVSAAQQG